MKPFKFSIFILICIMSFFILNTQSYATTVIERHITEGQQKLSNETLYDYEPPYPGAKVWRLYTYADTWSGTYYEIYIYKNGSWQKINDFTHFRGVDMYFTELENVTKIRLKSRESSGYCYVSYEILWGVFTNDYYDFNNMNNKIDNTQSAANNAKVEATAAKNSASTAAARVWDTSESKSAATLAKEARNKADTNYTKLLNIESKTETNYTKLQNLENSVTNIENTLAATDTTPPAIISIKGYKGATCTTGSTFTVVVQATDNSGALEFRVKADTGTWSGWVPISSWNTAAGITGNGAHTINVEVRDPAGNVSTGSMTVFKL